MTGIDSLPKGVSAIVCALHVNRMWLAKLHHRSQNNKLSIISFSSFRACQHGSAVPAKTPCQKGQSIAWGRPLGHAAKGVCCNNEDSARAVSICRFSIRRMVFIQNAKITKKGCCINTHIDMHADSYEGRFSDGSSFVCRWGRLTCNLGGK